MIKPIVIHSQGTPTTPITWVINYTLKCAGCDFSEMTQNLDTAFASAHAHAKTNSGHIVTCEGLDSLDVTSALAALQVIETFSVRQ